MKFKKGDNMQALILVLNKVELLDDVLNSLSKCGVSGATILDSQGMGSAILSNDENVPMFGNLENPNEGLMFTVPVGKVIGLHKQE